VIKTAAGSICMEKINVQNGQLKIQDISGKLLKRDAFSAADVTSEGRSFHVCAATTGKARLATVDSLTSGTTRRLVSAERRRGPWTARLVSDDARD